MTGAGLKWLAMGTMLIDHIAAVVLASAWGLSVDFTDLGAVSQALAAGGPLALYTLMRLVGRLAFPIFCFLLVEGLVHTRSRARYLRNLLLLAVASEVPFDLAVHAVPWNVQSQNVLWTLVLGFLACTALDAAERLAGTALDERARIVLQLAAVLVLMAAASFLHTDYDLFGVLLIVLLYLFRAERRPQCVCGAIVCAWEWTAPLAFLAIWHYNGRRGRQPKWLFYAFYPVHLLLLVAIRYAWIGF